jgi:hypothetical protein
MTLALGAWYLSGGRGYRILRILAPAVTILAGAYATSMHTRHSQHMDHQADELKILEFYDDIHEYSKMAGWDQPKFAVDRLVDYFAGKTYAAVNFERHGTYHEGQMQLGYLPFETDPRAAIESIGKTDFAFITERDSYASVTCPFDHQMIRMHKQILEEVQKHLILLKTYDLSTHKFSVYARPAVKVNGISGDWLTAEGASLNIPCQALQTKRVVTVGGRTIGDNFIDHKLLVRARFANTGADVPASAPPTNGHYSIRLDLSAQAIPPSGTCSINLDFDRSFIPRKVNSSPDDRKLVVFPPTEFKFE